jgi:hypothetical protein
MADVSIIVTCQSNVQLILKSPLPPLFQRGKSRFLLFGMNHTVHTFEKKGLGGSVWMLRIRMSIWIFELELIRSY